MLAARRRTVHTHTRLARRPAPQLRSAPAHARRARDRVRGAASGHVLITHRARRQRRHERVSEFGGARDHLGGRESRGTTVLLARWFVRAPPRPRVHRASRRPATLSQSSCYSEWGARRCAGRDARHGRTRAGTGTASECRQFMPSPRRRAPFSAFRRFPAAVSSARPPSAPIRRHLPRPPYTLFATPYTAH